MPALRPSPATATEIVQRFGLAAAPDGSAGLEPVGRGAMGRVWRLVLGDGSRYAVKERFTDPDDDTRQEVADEVAFTDAAVAVGVRAQTAIASVSGDHLYRLPDELGGSWVRVFTWAEGRTIRPDDPGRAELLGDVLGRLHAMRRTPHTAQDPWFTETPSPKRWSELVTAAERLPARWASTLRDRLPELRSLTHRIAPPSPAALIVGHRDVQPQNVVFDPVCGTSTVLDWEGCGPIEPERELATQLYTWHVRDDRLHTDGVRRTMLAYRAAGGTATVERFEAFSGGLTGYLNYLAGQVGEAVDPDRPPDMREHADAEVMNVLADAPDVDIMHRIVATARGI